MYNDYYLQQIYNRLGDLQRTSRRYRRKPRNINRTTKRRFWRS